MTPLNVLDNLADSLAIATIEQNWIHRLGRQTELRAKFNAPDLTIRQMGHFQMISLEGKEIVLGAMATDEQIAAEIAKVRQIQPITEKKMVSRLQSVASRLGQLKHDCEHDADKLLTRVDGTFARKDAAFAKSHKFLDGQEKDLADVEGFIAEIEQATNGGPE